MAQKTLIGKDSTLAGYRIVGRMGRHHHGSREVYLTTDERGKKAVLTVFNLKSPRYYNGKGDAWHTFHGICEPKVMETLSGSPVLPEFLGAGVDTYRRRRYGWMAQEFVEGELLEDVLIRRGALPYKDISFIVKRLSGVLSRVAAATANGGHYNVSPENIILRYEDGELVDVRLIGFANTGEASVGKSIIDASELDQRFRAPETCKGIYKPESDIYSLGMVTLMMTGGIPYYRDTDIDTHAYYLTAWQHCEKNLDSLLVKVLKTATDLNPDKRFATMESFKRFFCTIVKKRLQDTVVTPRPTLNPQPESFVKHQGGFKDVAGMAGLKSLFHRDFISIVKNPQMAATYGITPSNCTMLYGPQGCGKTFLAEKAAEESGLNYKVVRPSDLGSIYIHGSQKKIAEMFEEAEKQAPVILIFDEFDAMAPKRTHEMNENQAGEVNEMLAQLNNCAQRGIYCLCTTNRPDMIDPAVMRKGRVDKSIFVPLPDAEARMELFRLMLGHRPAEDDIDFEKLADITENYTCSDITYIVEETSRQCFEETIEKELSEPVKISTLRIMEMAKATIPSVSETQRKEYKRLQEEMEQRNQSDRMRRIGYR